MKLSQLYEASEDYSDGPEVGQIRTVTIVSGMGAQEDVPHGQLVFLPQKTEFEITSFTQTRGRFKIWKITVTKSTDSEKVGRNFIIGESAVSNTFKGTWHDHQMEFFREIGYKDDEAN
jgi:hypothetical protein